MTTISVDLPAGGVSYDVVIQNDLMDHAGALIAEKTGQRRCVIVTDDVVAPLYLDRIKGSLAKEGHKVLTTVVVESGEASKCFSVLEDVLEQVLAAGMDRKSLLIALGGGVVGDLGGCAAALALRGIDLIQVPTTLLAQVDSSVGGKNGINSAHGKNTVGTFYQPRLVLVDPTTLDTLPVRQILAGYAEVVKYGLIRDAAFFEWCVANAERLVEGDNDLRIQAIRKSCAHKARIVESDEKESGARTLLNLGHSFGHALESAIGYDTSILLHGEAVAIGIVMSFRLSASLGLCPPSAASKVEKHFVDIGLPIKPPPVAFDVDELVDWMAHDKKAEVGTFNLVLAHEIGDAFLARKVDREAVRQVWLDFLK